MKVDFYHLTVRPLDRVLPQIAEKCVAAGERLLIVAAGEEQRRHLDRLLWSYAPESFLPHGLLGGGDEEAQPVLIAPDLVQDQVVEASLLVRGDPLVEPIRVVAHHDVLELVGSHELGRLLEVTW